MFEHTVAWHCLKCNLRITVSLKTWCNPRSHHHDLDDLEQSGVSHALLKHGSSCHMVMGMRDLPASRSARVLHVPRKRVSKRTATSSDMRTKCCLESNLNRARLWTALDFGPAFGVTSESRAWKHARFLISSPGPTGIWFPARSQNRARFGLGWTRVHTFVHTRRPVGIEEPEAPAGLAQTLAAVHGMLDSLIHEAGLPPERIARLPPSTPSTPSPPWNARVGRLATGGFMAQPREEGPPLGLSRPCCLDSQFFCFWWSCRSLEADRWGAGGGTVCVCVCYCGLAAQHAPPPTQKAARDQGCSVARPRQGSLDPGRARRRAAHPGFQQPLTNRGNGPIARTARLYWPCVAIE